MSATSARELPPYAKMLGLKFVKVSLEGIEAEIEVREDFGTTTA